MTRRTVSEEITGTFYNEAVDIGGAGTVTQNSDETLNVDDVDEVRLYCEFDSSAIDTDENVIVHVKTSPDGTDFEEGDTWEIPFPIKAGGTPSLNRPKGVRFDTLAMHSIRVSALQHTSASATITGVNVTWRKGRRR
jgi:hypothetical protein